jgi:hypothetical protein
MTKWSWAACELASPVFVFLLEPPRAPMRNPLEQSFLGAADRRFVGSTVVRNSFPLNDFRRLTGPLEKRQQPFHRTPPNSPLSRGL